MAIRGVQFRAIALPVCVAIVSVTALTWYRLMWIPGQETYLNERNLRTLHTTARQITDKLDNFDVAIDHARESLDEGESPARLARYLPLLAPELEIVDAAERARLKDTIEAADPPRVAVQRDEGRTYLYLAYQRDNQSPLYARADLERTVRPFLSTRSEFDAVFIADRRGTVIVPPSAPGFALAHLDRLSEKPESGGASKGDAGPTFEKLRGATSVVDVTIGATSYKLYVQPIQLSLKAQRDRAPHAKEAGASQSAAETRLDDEEEWALCGLVRADQFRAASSAWVTTYWLWLGLALASVVLSIPPLKLQVLSPRERLRSTDGGIVAATTMVIIALATVSLLDARYFGWVIPAERDAQLKEVANQMAANFSDETSAIDAQMTRFDPVRNPALWTERLAYSRTDIPLRGSQLDRLMKGPRFRLGAHASPVCVVPWSCRDALLSRIPPDDRQDLPYPYFALAVWSDQYAWQRIKWSTTDITPFLNLRTEKLAYYDDLALARRMSQPQRGTTKGVALVQSPNTGRLLTVFWKTLPLRPRPEAGDPSNKADLAGMSLATTPLSLVRPVLPKDVQFAVIDTRGNVLHHSDQAKSGTQNLFAECENNPTLRSLAIGRTEGWLDAPYLGRRHRLFVTSLAPAAEEGEPPFDDPHWTLVVFQDTSIQETLNLETLLLATVMLALYAAALAVLWALGYLWFPNLLRKWFWPVREHAARYQAVIIANVSLAVVCLTACSVFPEWRPPVALLGGIASFGAIFVLVRHGRWPAAAARAVARRFLLRACVTPLHGCRRAGDRLLLHRP